MEGLVKYFQYQVKHVCVAQSHEACFTYFLRCVDHMAVYFSSVGIGSYLCRHIIKITKLQSPTVRCKVAAAHSFRASSLQGSAGLWETAAPSLRVALEATSKNGDDVSTNRHSGVNGRRKRARTQTDV